MTDWSLHVVAQKDQDLPSIGKALQRVIARRWRKNAAKLVESAWGLDARTAKNVAEQGHVSERTLTKAAKAERWALWIALGEELFGESYEEHLHQVIEESARATQRMAQHRDAVRDLEARASKLVAMGHRMAAE